MANVNSPFGLRPLRHKSGAPYNGAANPYYIPSSYGTALFIGDPVVKTGTSNTARVKVPDAGSFGIGTLPEINKTAAGDVDGNTKRITGVIVGFSPLPTDLTKQYNPASTERVAYVCDDPDVVFEIQADGAIPAASIGLNGVLKHGTGSTYTGLSATVLDSGTTTAPSADASNQLLIVRASNREDNDTTLSYARVEVLINAHTEGTGYTAAGDGTLGI